MSEKIELYEDLDSLECLNRLDCGQSGMSEQTRLYEGLDGLECLAEWNVWRSGQSGMSEQTGVPGDPDSEGVNSI